MEVKVKNIDDLKEIKTSFGVDTVKSNTIKALQEVDAICKQKEYVVSGSIEKLISELNLENTTLTARKKLAKKIYYFEKKKSLKTMTAMVSYVCKRFAGDCKVTIKPSLLQQEIVTLRENYKKLYKETEEVRLKLKEKKKLFFEKNV